MENLKIKYIQVGVLIVVSALRTMQGKARQPKQIIMLYILRIYILHHGIKLLSINSRSLTFRAYSLCV